VRGPRYSHERLAPFKRIRLIEFIPDLPKTISGKIRRVQLRRWEYEGSRNSTVLKVSFSEVELAEEKGRRRLDDR
jgi:acetyl-CoA synthetase